jgi:hypothetical protein
MRTLAALCALALLSPCAPVAPTARAAGDDVVPRHVTEGELETVEMIVEGAVLAVHLPRAPFSGETVSGTATATLTAMTPGARKRAEKRLGRLTVEVGGVSWQPVPGERFVLRGLDVCGRLACTGDAVAVRLLDPKGRALAEARVPVVGRAGAAPREFTVRSLGVIGELAHLAGPFDGDAANTRWTAHGDEATVLAESSRGLTARVPVAAVGPGEQVLEEAGRTYRFPFRGLAVRLGAGKAALQSGERTAVQLHIQGLDDLAEPLRVQLVSRQPAYAVLAAGPVETLDIHPTEVQGGGVYQWVGTAVGVSPGPLDLRLSTHHAGAELSAPAQEP